MDTTETDVKPPPSVEEWDSAIKKAEEATKHNRLVFKLDYEKSLILSHKAGLAFVEAMQSAEILYQKYSSGTKRIGSFDSDVFPMRVMTHEEYLNIKIANLLNVSVEEVEQHKKA